MPVRASVARRVGGVGDGRPATPKGGNRGCAEGVSRARCYGDSNGASRAAATKCGSNGQARCAARHGERAHVAFWEVDADSGRVVAAAKATRSRAGASRAGALRPNQCTETLFIAGRAGVGGARMRRATREQLDDDHRCAALPTDERRRWRRRRVGGKHCSGLGCGLLQQRAGDGEVVLAPGIGEQPVVADAMEAAGQHVQQEAAHELGGPRASSSCSGCGPGPDSPSSGR